jgi:hypothetical protein
MICLGGPVVVLTRLTVGSGGAVVQIDPPDPEHVTLVLFELTVPIEATTENGVDDVNEADGVNVNVAIPPIVVTIPPRPVSTPPTVTVKVTDVPSVTGTPFNKTSAVLVMEEPEPHTIEEVPGETTMVDPDPDPAPEHPLIMVSNWLIETRPFLASARPFRMPPFSVMLVNAIIVPTKGPFVVMNAEEPTCQNTLQGDAPLKTTLEPTWAVRALGTWKIHVSVEEPISVRVPVSSSADEAQ